MMQQSDSERRRSRRATIYMPVNCFQDSAGRGLTGRTVDVGPGGVRLMIDDVSGLTIGEDVYIRIDTISGDGFVNVRGEIRWIKPGDSYSHEVGLKLIGMELDDWDRWMDLLPH